MKICILFFLAAFSASMAIAQEIRLNAYGHYIFDDKIESYYNSTNYFSGTVKGGFLWGLGLESKVLDYYVIELTYLHQGTTVPVHYYDNRSFGEKSADLDLKNNWILICPMRSQRVSDEVEGYAGVLLGIGILDANNPDNQKSSTVTKFAWGMKTGCNIWVTPKFGIKAQMQLISTVQAAGGSFYFGTGGSSSAGVTVYSSILQFSLGGGLIYKLK